MEKKTRHVWNRKETLAFLESYGARKDEFQDPIKKKQAMLNVLEDLTLKGVFSDPVSIGILQIKIKNLLRAYKSAKDAANKTGTCRVEAPFEEQMDVIFGDRPICSNSLTLTLNGNKTQAIQTVNFVTKNGAEVLKEAFEVENDQPPKRESTRANNFRQKKLIILKEYLGTKVEMKKIAEQNKERRHQEKMNLLKDFLNANK